MRHQGSHQKKTAAPTRQQPKPTKTSVKSPVHPVEELQAAIGNREMGRLMETNRLPHPSSPVPKLQGELPLLGDMMPVSQGTIQPQPLFRGLSQEMRLDTAMALPATGAVIQPKLSLSNEVANDRVQIELKEGARVSTACGQYVQRKIKVGDEWFSFQNVYDENGNPFLRGHKNNQINKFRKHQALLDLRPVDDYYVTLNEQNKENTFRNLSYGRPMHLVIGKQKTLFLLNKDYKYNPISKFDIAVFHEKNKRGMLYTDILKKLLLPINSDPIERDVVLQNMLEIESIMYSIIYAEEYRNLGALEVYSKISDEVFNRVAQAFQENPIEEEQHGKSARFILRDKLTRLMEKLSICLPWAGDGGKKKFKTQLEKDEWGIGKKALQNEPSEYTWFDIRSPKRKSNKRT